MNTILEIIQTRDLERLTEVIQETPDLPLCNDRAWTPLHAAAWEGWSEGVESLLTGDVDINAQDTQGLTALHLAAYEGHTVCVSTLIRNGSRSTQADRSGIATARHWALLAGHPHIARLLSVAQQSNDINGWLHLACAQNAVDTVETLHGWGGDIDRLNRDEETPLGVAVRHGQLQIIEFLIREGACVTVESSHMLPLGIAIMQGHLDVADLLLRNGAGINDVDANGRRAMHWATRSTTGNYDLVQYCIDRNASLDLPSEGGNLPLHWALAHGDDEIAATVLARTQHVDKPNDQGITPLFWACVNSSVDLVDELLARKANAHHIDQAGNSALHWAARNPDSAIIAKLIQAGALTDPHGASGATPLHWAVRSGLVDNVLALLDHGADGNRSDDSGDTALHWCARFGEEDVITALIDAGVDINKINNAAQTALHIAVQERNEYVMEALLDEDADVDCVDASGESARTIIERLAQQDSLANQQRSLVMTMARYVDDIDIGEIKMPGEQQPARQTLEILPIRNEVAED